MENLEQRENIYERKDIEKTPFSAIHEVQKDLWYIAIGNYRISTETFSTFEEAIKYAKKPNWELIFNTTALICDNLIKNNQNHKKND